MMLCRYSGFLNQQLTTFTVKNFSFMHCASLLLVFKYRDLWTLNHSTKVKADDPENQCDIGDRVEIAETRPLSKDKRWRLVRIVEKVK